MTHIAYALSERQGFTDVHGIFNAGVLLLNLEILRRGENLLLEGLKFLRDHGGQWDFFDNDILIGFFAKRYIHLPYRFHLRLGWAWAYVEMKSSARLRQGLFLSGILEQLQGSKKPAGRR